MALTPQQLQAVELLLTAPTHRAVAAAVGVTPTTISNWMRNPEFAAALDAAANEVLAGTVRRLKRRTINAADRLIFEMDARFPDKSRIAAADKVLTQCLRYADAHELRARLDCLEQQLRPADGAAPGMDPEAEQAARPLEDVTDEQPPPGDGYGI